MALCCPGRTSSPHRTKSFIQQELYSDTGASLQGWLDLGTKPVLAFARTSPLDPRKTRQVSGHSSGFSHSAVFSFLSSQHHPLLFLIAFPSYRPSITLSSFLLLLSDLPPLCGVPASYLFKTGISICSSFSKKENWSLLSFFNHPMTLEMTITFSWTSV